MRRASAAAHWGAPAGVIAALALAQFALPAYHHTNLARIMVLATFAIGYNVAFGYAGLLSLGHAMFFAAGLYGAGMSAHFLQFPAPAAFAVGVLGGLALAFLVGLIALRTRGVAFLIVTLMFAQAGYLTSLYFAEYTRGDEGFVLRGDIRRGSVRPVPCRDLMAPPELAGDVPVRRRLERFDREAVL